MRKTVDRSMEGNDHAVSLLPDVELPVLTIRTGLDGAAATDVVVAGAAGSVTVVAGGAELAEGGADVASSGTVVAPASCSNE